MKPRSVTVFAPATISNLGPGFDVLGLAISKPGDVVVASRQREPGLSFVLKTRTSGIPPDARRNVAGYVAFLMIKEFRPPFGIHMVLDKRMPLGSGLGSSAASSVAAAVAVNALLSKPVQRRDLLRFVLEGERLACGAPHADNAAPALIGGACLIRSYDPLDVLSIPVSRSIVWIIAHPHVIVRTEKARSILPRTVPLRSAIHQWGNVGGLTVGLATGDCQLVGKCIDDVIIEPLRARLIPGFYRVKEAALAAGAVGCSISGSGPSVFAVTSSFQRARSIGRAMAKAFRDQTAVPCDVYVSRVNTEGARVLRVRSG